MRAVSFDILTAPGLFTDQTHPPKADVEALWDLHELSGAGYDWVSYQLINGGAVTGVDIREYGMLSGFKSCGAWGVVYDEVDFYPFGVRFARELVRQGAQHAIVDAEFCAKFTRDGQRMLPIIRGMRDGGWAGPVHLSTLGAPFDARPHGPNDFAMDVKSFLDTGGGVLPQAYFNASSAYRPDLCVDYWVACGVPRERVNVTIELAVESGTEKAIKIDGAGWDKLLADAGCKRNFSCYMVQHMTKADIAGLAARAKLPVAPPAPKAWYWDVKAKAGTLLHSERAVTYPDGSTGYGKTCDWLRANRDSAAAAGGVSVERVTR